MASSDPHPIDGMHRRKLAPGMKRPHDVIHHCGRYIVTDTHNNRVISVHPGDGSSEVLCQNKDGLLRGFSNMEPYGIVALSDKEQNFLFTDLKNRCVIEIKNGQNQIWTEKDAFEKIGRPTGIAVDTQGMVFVADCGKHCIHVFNNCGKYVSAFGSEDLAYPWFLALNSAGHIYVADEKHGIKVFDEEYNKIDSFCVHTDNSSWSCRGIAIDRYDNVFVTARVERSMPLASSNEKVTVYDHSHNAVTNFGGFGHFHYIRGLCFDYEKNLIVIVDGEKHTLQLYTLYTTPLSQSLQPSALGEGKLDNNKQKSAEAAAIPDNRDEDDEEATDSAYKDMLLKESDNEDDMACYDDDVEDKYEYDESDLQRPLNEEYYHIAKE